MYMYLYILQIQTRFSYASRRVQSSSTVTARSGTACSQGFSGCMPLR